MGELTNTKMADDLIEANTIIRELAAIRDRLSMQDGRFLESWETYLEREGDDARIGAARLANLSTVAAHYGLISPELVQERLETARAGLGMPSD